MPQDKIRKRTKSAADSVSASLMVVPTAQILVQIFLILNYIRIRKKISPEQMLEM